MSIIAKIKTLFIIACIAFAVCSVLLLTSTGNLSVTIVAAAGMVISFCTIMISVIVSTVIIHYKNNYSINDSEKIIPAKKSGLYMFLGNISIMFIVSAVAAIVISVFITNANSTFIKADSQPIDVYLNDLYTALMNSLISNGYMGISTQLYSFAYLFFEYVNFIMLVLVSITMGAFIKEHEIFGSILSYLILRVINMLIQSGLFSLISVFAPSIQSLSDKLEIIDQLPYTAQNQQELIDGYISNMVPAADIHKLMLISTMILAVATVTLYLISKLILMIIDKRNTPKT